MAEGEVQVEKAEKSLKGRVKIPRKALAGLWEICEGKVERFEELLSLMVKYADYFLDRPWPEKMEKELRYEEDFGLGDEDVEFLDESKNYEEKVQRFTLVCLKRNISLEGFDVEGFKGDFNSYGGSWCWDCTVTRAMELRKEVERQEQFRRKIEKEMKSEKPAWTTLELYKHINKPEIVREDKMRQVELRFYEELGYAKDKSCEVRNFYRCPYGGESEKLILRGMAIKEIWQHIEWYHRHWHPSRITRPLENEMKWYHYGEPDIIDVTSYEDLEKASEDGRLDKVIEEHEKYMKETGRKAWET
ncbi:hypothetical protein [Candidatus Hecatella orcuttiae]|jgi:hypothetical protein|uniref:hypothetical protein n=1 Tax=Candidatus Hecatella orcuttiae TaxID=1935119 RepID=UPI002867F78B|nr:hypothetical protein [Candidatus Hecatella orcuttiae]